MKRNDIIILNTTTSNQELSSNVAGIYFDGTNIVLTDNNFATETEIANVSAAVPLVIDDLNDVNTTDSITGSVLVYNGNEWTAGDISDTQITSNGTDISTMELSGGIPTSLVPDASGVYDLGSSDRPFRDLYLTNNSLYFDDKKLSVINKELQIDNVSVSSVINVKHFGVVGDGTTDDHSAIQAIIDDASNNGHPTVVYFPDGEYAITKRLFIKDNVHLRGSGRIKRHATPDVFKFPLLLADGVSDWSISDLHFENIDHATLLAEGLANNSGVEWNNNIITVRRGCQRWLVEGITATKFSCGVQVQDDCHYFSIRNCYLDAQTGKTIESSLDGTWTDFSAYHTAGGIEIKDSRGSSLVTTSTFYNIYDNIIIAIGLDSGIGVGIQSYDPIYASVHGNDIQGTYAGVQVYTGTFDDPGTATTINKNLKIQNNSIRYTRHQGIYMRGVAGVLCSNNYIEKCALEGALNGSFGGIENRIPPESIYTNSLVESVSGEATSGVSFDIGNHIDGNYVINCGEPTSGAAEAGIRFDSIYTNVINNTVGRTVDWFGENNLRQGKGIIASIGFAPTQMKKLTASGNKVYGYEWGIAVWNSSPVEDIGAGQILISNNAIYDVITGISIDGYSTGVHVNFNTVEDAEIGLTVRNSPRTRIQYNTVSNCSNTAFHINAGNLESDINSSTTRIGQSLIINNNDVTNSLNSFKAVSTNSDDAVLLNRVVQFENNTVDGDTTGSWHPFYTNNGLPPSTFNRRLWSTGDTSFSTDPSTHGRGRICVSPGQYGTLTDVSVTASSGSDSVVFSTIEGLVEGVWLTFDNGSDPTEDKQVITLDLSGNGTVDSVFTSSYETSGVSYVTPVFEKFEGLALTELKSLKTVNDILVGNAEDAGTDAKTLSVGLGRSGDGNSQIRLIGDTVNTNYGLRIDRQAGENGNTVIGHRGTGGLNINAENDGYVQILRNSVPHTTFAADGTLIPFLNMQFRAVNGLGVRFTGAEHTKIYHSEYNDATYGGRLDSTSSHNMYFRITSSNTNRGFVFLSGTDPVHQIDSNGNIWIKETGAIKLNGSSLDSVLTSTHSIDIGDNQLTTAGYLGTYYSTIEDTSGSTKITANGDKVFTMELSGGIPTSLVPDASGVYDLGSSDRPFRDITLSGNLDIEGSIIYSGSAIISGAGGSPDTTATGTIPVYFLDGSSNTCTLALDTNPADGQRYDIKSIDSSNTVTIDRNGNTIDGDTSNITLATNESATLIYKNSFGWAIL